MSMRSVFGQKNKVRAGLLIPSVVLIALTGCGGGGGGGETPPPPADTLSGTAAAGAAIIGQVTVKGSAGNVVTALIEANGNYNVDVSTLTAPYMLRAEGTVGGRNYELHSYAETSDIGGTVNITPFTDLIVSNAAGQIASSYFDAGDFSSLTTAEIEAQETALQAKLQDVFDDLGVDAAVDLLHTTFSADHTTLDAALDLVRITVDSGTNVATITNVIDDTELFDNVTDTTDNTGVLEVLTADLGTVQSDYEAIAARIADFSGLFAAGLPNSSQLDPFLASDFLDSGRGRAQFITFVSTTPQFVGIGFTNVTIEALNQTAGTATVSFHISLNGIADPKSGSFEMAKNGGVWETRGNQEIVDIWMGFICDHSHWPDGSDYKTCGINLGVEDNAATDNPGSVLVDSAKVTLVRNGMPVVGSEIYMGVPTSGGFAGELRIYDQDYTDDFIGFGTGALELDSSLIQAGDQMQFELYTAGLDLTDVNNPAVVGTAIATYTRPIVAVPHTNAATASLPTISQTTVNALSSFSSGNLAVSWTVPTGMVNESVSFEVCDGTNCLETEEWTLGDSATSTTLTIDTSSLDMTSYTAELGVYAMDIYGQSFLTYYRVNASDTSGGGTPPPGGSSLTCATESGWDDTADGGLGAPITPYSFADFEAVVADCGSAGSFARADVAGNVFDDAGETTAFNDTGAAATVADPETGSFDDGAGFVVNFEWYIENAACAGCTHSYLVLYTNSTIANNSNFPAGHAIRETNALTGQSASTFTFTTYSEGINYGDMVRSTGTDGEIWNSIKTLTP